MPDTELNLPPCNDGDGSSPILGLNNTLQGCGVNEIIPLLPICRSAGSPTIASEQEQTGNRQRPNVAHFYCMCLLQCLYHLLSQDITTHFFHHWETWRRPGQPASCSIDHSLCMFLSIKVTFAHASTCEMSRLWNRHFRIVTTNDCQFMFWLKLSLCLWCFENWLKPPDRWVCGQPYPQFTSAASWLFWQRSW